MIGNPALRPETGWAWDVGGGRWQESGRSVGPGLRRGRPLLAGVILIVWSQNSQRTMVPVNVGEAWVQGFEVSSALDLLGRVDLDASLTRTISRNLVPRAAVANNQLPRIPPWETWIGTSIRRKSASGSGTVGPTPLPTTGTQPTTSAHQPAASMTPSSASRLFPASRWAAVRNLLDQRVDVVDRDPLDTWTGARRVQALTDFAGYPLPGRTFLFTLTWTG